MEHHAGIQAVIGRRSTSAARYYAPWWRVLQHQKGVLPALNGRAERRLHRRGPADPLLTRVVKPNGRLRTVMYVPVEAEHLMIAESTALVRVLAAHPRRDVAFANPVRWANDLWYRPPFSDKQRKEQTGRIRSATRILTTQTVWAAQGDIKRFYPSLEPRYWVSQLASATGMPVVDIVRCLHRLRDVAVEVQPFLGRVGLPVGPELSDVVGNAVLHPMDEALVARVGTAAYVRFVDDFAIATEGYATGLSDLADIEREFMSPIGLELGWPKCRVVPALALKLVGDVSVYGDDPDVVAHPRLGEAFHLSRAQARGIIAACAAEGDSGAMRLAGLAPRLLAASHDVGSALIRHGTPLPSEITEHLVASLASPSAESARVGAVGNLLLQLTEKSPVELSARARRDLVQLATHSRVNQHTAAAAAWVLADQANTFDDRILARVDELVTPAARAVAGAAVRAGEPCTRGLRQRCALA
jgi:hypothetical protein